MTHVKYQQGILTAPNYGFSGVCVCVCVLEKNDARRLTFLQIPHNP